MSHRIERIEALISTAAKASVWEIVFLLAEAKKFEVPGNRAAANARLVQAYRMLQDLKVAN